MAKLGTWPDSPDRGDEKGSNPHVARPNTRFMTQIPGLPRLPSVGGERAYQRYLAASATPGDTFGGHGLPPCALFLTSRRRPMGEP